VKRLTVAVGIWALTLIVCTVAAVFSFLHVDVPLVRYFWNGSRLLSPLGQELGAAVILTAESLVVMAVVGMRLVRGRVPALAEDLAIACLCSICAYGINDHVLKMLFGVPSPAAVMRGARHVVHFYSGSEGSSFPSGHMALAGAFAGVFMRLYKVSILPLSALLLLAAALLLGGDWHFLSDVIAGSFFGISAGLIAGEGRAAHDRRQ
jgi:membrane-associated phospholipid phosphatase